MKIRLLAIAALALSLPLAGAAPKKASLLSAFAGPHNGTIVFSGYPGTTTGSFKASKKKETGSLILQSSVAASGSTLAITEQFTFTKNSVTWHLDTSESILSGTGTARITKNEIAYTIPIDLGGGGLTGLLTGTMTLAKNHHLTVQETFSYGYGSAVIFCQLNGKKPKK